MWRNISTLRPGKQIHCILTERNPVMTTSSVPLLPKFYTAAEERLNVLTHGLGLVLSVVGLILLVVRAATYGSAVHIVSFAIFGASLVILYGASTIYHSTNKPTLRTHLRAVDHAAIYVLIAGSYTPFTLTVFPDKIGWVIFGAVWSMAAVGITLKIFFTGRLDLLSTLMYIFMGWMIVFAIKPLIAALSDQGLFWLFAGGVAYTLGAVSYSIKKIPYGHAIFHVLVLAGSACHFIAVYWYILPRP